MTGLIKLFTSFDGRIGRKAFWFGLIVLVIASPFSFSTLFATDVLNELVGNVRKLGLSGAIWSLVLIYVMAVLIIKRLHDRNKPGYYAALVYAPAVVQSLTFFLAGAEWASWLQWAIDWSWLIGMELAVVGLWFFIELGLFGPKDPNNFGPPNSEA